MHTHPTDAAAFLDDQDGLFELGRLHGRAPSGRARADHDQVKLLHGPSAGAIARFGVNRLKAALTKPGRTFRVRTFLTVVQNALFIRFC
jgi:hypothetical protein